MESRRLATRAKKADVLLGKPVSQSIIKHAGYRWRRAKRVLTSRERKSPRAPTWGLPMRKSSPSIPIGLDLQQRERAEDMGQVGRRRRMQIGFVEFGERCDAEQA